MKKCLLTLLLLMGLSVNAPVAAHWLQDYKAAVWGLYYETAEKLNEILKSLFKKFVAVKISVQESRQRLAGASSRQPTLLEPLLLNAVPQDSHKCLFYQKQETEAQARLQSLLRELAPEELQKPVPEHKE